MKPTYLLGAVSALWSLASASALYDLAMHQDACASDAILEVDYIPSCYIQNASCWCDDKNFPNEVGCVLVAHCGYSLSRSLGILQDWCHKSAGTNVTLSTPVCGSINPSQSPDIPEPSMIERDESSDFNGGQSGDLSTGAIVGVTIGGLVGLSAILVGACCIAARNSASFRAANIANHSTIPLRNILPRQRPRPTARSPSPDPLPPYVAREEDDPKEEPGLPEYDEQRASNRESP